MLVGLVGHPYSGKSTFASFLKAKHNFAIVDIRNERIMREFGLLGYLAKESELKEEEKQIMTEASGLTRKISSQADSTNFYEYCSFAFLLLFLTADCLGYIPLRVNYMYIYSLIILSAIIVTY